MRAATATRCDSSATSSAWRDDYQPVTEIRFFFNGNRPPRINNDWLRSIMATADAATGLRLVKEPAEPLGASAYAGIEG